MNLNNFELNLNKRNELGSGRARALRNEKKIPAVIYVRGKESISAVINEDDLQKALASKTLFNKFTNIHVDGKKMMVFAKIVQKHPVNDKLVHIDFQTVSKEDVIKMRVPIEFVNKDLCETIKLGGLLNVVCSFVELVGPAQHLPESLIVDLSTAKVGVSIKVEHLNIPSSVKVPTKFANKVVATILAAKKKGGDAADGAAAAE